MYKLLIVDDEEEVRRGISDYFPWHEIGFEIVHQADNGKAALEYIVNHPVDAVLCDVQMPIMTGIALAENIRALNRQLKVVFLSAYRQFEYAQKALEFGVKNYIVKPVKYTELVHVFNQIKEELDKEYAKPALELQASIQKPPEPISHHDKIILVVKRYIQDHYKDVTLESAAGQAHMNPHYFSKFFKGKTGQNFYDYVIEVRMKKAAELLEDINLKTYDVSEQVGYTNPKNFSRVFRSYYNLTPTQYRNKQSGLDLSEHDL
ncbi:response regulator transcription factor [Paenibacillus cremeus]|uniref:Response regulator n=1 Tax=Paenibacillus cremeus TaxID=2163881 RepID=A0A559K795_9BACL|nr:response regulator [Paenibacillus cremeus]TVY07999.1 response regulator [Paenibacillus cremeus]